MKKILLLSLLFCALPAFSQNCSPFMGIAAVQFTDNLGTPLTNGALYVYQAGTSSQAPSFQDSQCSIPNTNPVTFTTGGRATIWINTGSFFKYVLCQVSTDGPACSGGDQLFSIDNVPGGAAGGGGGGGAPFITSSANPATTGVLRCASGDACLAFRNTANSANLTLTKDSNDLLTWGGGSIKLPEVGTPTSILGFDILNPNNTTHRFEQCSNGASCVQLVNAGVDVNTNDQVTQIHFGSTGISLGNTAPTTGQFLQFNGSQVVGIPAPPVAAAANQTAQAANISATTLVTPSANGFYRISCYIVLTTAASTSSTLPGCNVGFTDADSNQPVTMGLLSSSDNANTVGSVVPILVTGAGANPNFFNAKSGVAITYSTSGYASNPASAMQYAVHVRLEGPF